MTLIKAAIGLSIFFCMTESVAQDLDSYRWKNRLIILSAPAVNDESISNQIAKFEDKDSEIEDRKIKILVLSPEGFKDLSSGKWRTSLTYQKLRTEKTGFELFLIGLDGGVKLRSTEVTNPKIIFDLIDSMPMRRQELRNKN